MKNVIIALLLSLFLTSFFLEAAEIPPCVKEGETKTFPKGFLTGSMYLKTTEGEKSAYAMGALDGMLMAPAFGVPEKCTKWLIDFTGGMTNEHVAAIITKYLKDNPEVWHEQLNVLVLNAMNEAYRKQHSE